MKAPEWLENLLHRQSSKEEEESDSPIRKRGRGYTKPTYNFLKAKKRRKMANISRRINRRRTK